MPGRGKLLLFFSAPIFGTLVALPKANPPNEAYLALALCTIIIGYFIYRSNDPPPKKRAVRRWTDRLSLDLEPGAKENLAALRSRAKLTTLTELVRKSVALFDVATAHQLRGGKVVFRNPDGTEETLFLL